MAEARLKQLGNASKRLKNASPGPWVDWPETDRADRAIRFIETFCRPPKGYGAGQPLKLAEFQKDWLRTVLQGGVNSAAMSVARGNGKSTFLGAVATWALFDEEEDSGAPQVPIVATTVQQAIRTVYGVAAAMIAAEPALEERSIPFTAIGATKTLVPINGGEMFPVSNDPNGLQGLDPSLAVCDELGFMPIESWDSLLLASGKRPRSLVVGIGTPGFDKSSSLWHLRSRVRDGAALPGFRFAEYTATEGCSITDEDEWRRANPALEEGYMNPEALHTAAALSPEAHFRIFRLGQWVEGTDSWLGADGFKVWDALTDPYDFSPTAPTWIGVDVGLKRDSTAVCVVQERPDGRFHAKVRLWLPTAEEAVDVTDVMAHLRDLDSTYEVQEVSYDPRFFDVPAKMLDDEGLPMVEIPQSLERMTPACATAYELIMGGQVTHDGDAGFAHQVLNAVARFNERGFTLAKGKSRGRIDGAVALVLALDRAVREDPGAEAFVV